jgi:hypothetical protein
VRVESGGGLIFGGKGTMPREVTDVVFLATRQSGLFEGEAILHLAIYKNQFWIFLVSQH